MAFQADSHSRAHGPYSLHLPNDLDLAPDQSQDLDAHRAKEDIDPSKVERSDGDFVVEEVEFFAKDHSYHYPVTTKVAIARCVQAIHH